MRSAEERGSLYNSGVSKSEKEESITEEPWDRSGNQAKTWGVVECVCEWIALEVLVFTNTHPFTEHFEVSCM